MKRTLQIPGACAPTLRPLGSRSCNSVDAGVASQPNLVRVPAADSPGRGKDRIGGAGRGILRGVAGQSRVHDRAWAGGVVTVGRYPVTAPAGALKSGTYTAVKLLDPTGW